MEVPPAAPLISFLLAMFLIVCTGTAWFIALHPRFIWRIIQGGNIGEDPPSAYYRMLRLGGIMFGAIGLFLLFMADLFS